MCKKFYHENSTNHKWRCWNMCISVILIILGVLYTYAGYNPIANRAYLTFIIRAKFVDIELNYNNVTTNSIYNYDGHNCNIINIYNTTEEAVNSLNNTQDEYIYVKYDNDSTCNTVDDTTIDILIVFWYCGLIMTIFGMILILVLLLIKFKVFEKCKNRNSLDEPLMNYSNDPHPAVC